MSLPLFISATAELFKNEGNDKFGKKDFSNAILLYTKGIKVNCKDEELNAKLYSNKATAHLNTGEILRFSMCIFIMCSTHTKTKLRVINVQSRTHQHSLYLLSIFAQVTSTFHGGMQRLPWIYNRLMSMRLL